MAGTFSASVDEWVRETKARMVAVFRTAAQYTIHESEMTRAEGGHMRVDTGFLRASGLTSLNSMPAIRANARPAEGQKYAYDGGQTALVIAGADIGDTIYHGFTAAYAGYRENKDGFVRLAAQNWQINVDRAAQQAKAAAGAV